jgi:hypothetical protein
VRLLSERRQGTSLAGLLHCPRMEEPCWQERHSTTASTLMVDTRAYSATAPVLGGIDSVALCTLPTATMNYCQTITTTLPILDSPSPFRPMAQLLRLGRQVVDLSGPAGTNGRTCCVLKPCLVLTSGCVQEEAFLLATQMIITTQLARLLRLPQTVAPLLLGVHRSTIP